MFVSNFEAPARLLARINDLLYEHDRSLSSFRSESDCLVSAISFLLHEDENSHYDIIPAEQWNRNAAQRVGLKIGNDYIVWNSIEDMSWNPERSLNDLQPEDCAVIFRGLRMSYYGQLVLLHYDSIGMWSIPGCHGNDAFDFYEGILQECRSVIVDLESLEIVSLPFCKFFNMGEREDCSLENVAARIEVADHVEFTDKLDGSFIQMGYAEGRGNIRQDIVVSTSGSIDPAENDYLQFLDSYFMEHPELRYEQLCQENADYSWIFEFIFPFMDQHLVHYDEEDYGLYLIGARNVANGEVLYHNDLEGYAEEYNVPVVHFFEGISLDEVRNICNEANVLDREGFVANIDNFLVKIKVDDFVRISHLMNVSFNEVIRAVVQGQFDDMISRVPVPYRQPLYEQYSALTSYDERMSEEISSLVQRVPTDCELRESIQWIQQNVPHSWISYVILGFKRGLASLPTTYLARHSDTSSPSYFNERQFEEAQDVLNSFVER